MKKEITYAQYQAACKTILAYREQVKAHSAKIGEEVNALNPNGKRKWGKPQDFSHCTKQTTLMRSKISHRLFNILTKGHEMNLTADSPIEELEKISLQHIVKQRNFGTKCMNELLELCRQVKIQMLP